VRTESASTAARVAAICAGLAVLAAVPAAFAAYPLPDAAAERLRLPASAAAPTARTLRVSAIGYTLRGRTASGLPTRRGIAAVDPRVIPLGTRLFVPGYGNAVAADTGGAVRGHVIDLWFETNAQARAWGRRTVVITLR
jgi:3D (Asp-Asp-Asp) domain-containing protein